MASEIFNGRHGGTVNGDFVLFLIGARINRFASVPKFLRIARQMRQMQAELMQHPEMGCLHIENWFGRNTLSVQYWRSFDHLETYSRSPDAAHLPAWRSFNQTIRDSGDVGIWHETYKVPAGGFEAIYGNMPRYGLAMAGEHAQLGRESTAALRSGTRGDDVAPVDAY